MRKAIFYSLLLLPLLAGGQQHPGFSKLYRYEGDTTNRFNLFTTGMYDTVSNTLFLNLETAPATNFSMYFCSLMQVDLEGNVLATTTDSVTGYRTGYHAVCKKGDYLYWAGWIRSDIPGTASDQEFPMLIKTDMELNLIWRRTYPHECARGKFTDIAVGSEPALYATYWKQTVNDHPYYPPSPTVSYLMEIDTATGDMLQEVQVGHSPDCGVALSVKPNGEHTVGGYAYDGNNNAAPFATSGTASGTELWYQNYNKAISTWLINMSVTHEGSYACTGTSVIHPDTATGFISKLDEGGQELWRTNLKPAGTGSDGGFWDICESVNGGAYVASGGGRQAIPTLDKGWLSCVDTAGQVLWNRVYTVVPGVENTMHEYLYKVIPLPDGGYIAAGSGFGTDPQGRPNRQAGWLLRVDSLGCMDAACATGLSEVPAAPAPQVRIFPNPATGPFTLTLQEGVFKSHDVIDLMDGAGRLLRSWHPAAGSSSLTCDPGCIAAGAYLIRLRQGNQSFAYKMVIR